MDYFTYYQRMGYLLELIRKERLHSPHELTTRFGCSERTIRKMINDLRRDGYVIRYSRRRSRYLMEK